MNTATNKCIIFSAGDFYGLRDEIHKVTQDDFIIAADSGYKNCTQCGLSANLIIGDFDSMDEPAEQNQNQIERFPVEKDDTDTMLAIKAGLERGYTEFHLYGATGGARLDHSLANLQGLAYLAKNAARGYIYDNNYVYTAINGTNTNAGINANNVRGAEYASITINKNKDWGLFSIFCIGKEAQGVTITGAQYPLDNGKLDAFFPLGVSNHFGDDDSVTIEVQDGCLLIGWELG